jgi:protein-S-isoprenylcysteine O-methyltransferase Ste14
MKINIPLLVVQIAGLAAVFALALFLPAGTWAWPASWVFMAVFFGCTLALTLWLLRANPALLNERMRGAGQADQPLWDKVFLGLANLVFFGWLALMALDAARWRWSQVPLWLQGAGLLLLLGSFWLFFLVFRENSFLSPAVRLQGERGQTVISTGPYHYVRHPMYAAVIPFAAGTSLLLGSWYGLLAAALLMLLVARRAVLEERTLRQGLAGYDAYLSEVKYRLVPYVW